LSPTQSSKVCITLIYYWRTCWRGRNASQRVSVVPQVHLLPVALVSPSWPSQSFLATSNAHTAQTQKAPGVCVVCPSIQGHPLEIVKATPSRPTGLRDACEYCEHKSRGLDRSRAPSFFSLGHLRIAVIYKPMRVKRIRCRIFALDTAR